MEEKYVCNMVQMAERALENNSTLEKLVMVEYPQVRQRPPGQGDTTRQAGAQGGLDDTVQNNSLGLLNVVMV